MSDNRIINQYTMETVLKLIEKLANQNGEKLDMLMMYAEENESNQKDIKRGIDKIDSKLDTILERLQILENDFIELKNENRETEQKITLMTSKLSKIENDVSVEELDDYYSLAQSLYDNWESLEELTRRFIPLAEFLYSKLQKLDNPDYSPVIIELCRAIEYEFLRKVFQKYTLDLINRYNTKNSLYNFLSTERSKSELKNKTDQFAKAITKAFNTKKPEYTLEQMNTILSFTKDASIVSISPLLQDFVTYLNNNTESNKLLNKTYIEKINDIVKDYRNPSAHPGFMSRQKAEKCKEIMPDRLDY